MSINNNINYSFPISPKRTVDSMEPFTTRPELKRSRSGESINSSMYDTDDQSDSMSIYSDCMMCQDIHSNSSKLCKVPYCENEHLKRSPYCNDHCGSRECVVADCKRAAQGTTPFCIGHGGGKRCQYANCSKYHTSLQYIFLNSQQFLQIQPKVPGIECFVQLMVEGSVV